MPRGPASMSSLVMAPYDAPSKLKRLADPYVGDGSGDQVVVNAAINDAEINSAIAGRKGSVHIGSGRVPQTGPILYPGRGFKLSGEGFNTELFCEVASGSFAADGEGSEKALIKFASTPAARNATEIILCDLFGNCDNRGISFVWFDQGAGGDTDAGSAATYGQPTTATDGDVYHSLARLRWKGVRYAIGFQNTAVNNARGITCYDIRGNGVSVTAYLTDTASDIHMALMHAITSLANNARGFDLGGGNTRCTDSKAAYFNHTGAWGFVVSGSRVKLADFEAQDNENGVQWSGIDGECSGRIETQDTPCTTAFELTTADQYLSASLKIHTRNSGTYVNGLYLPTASATTGIGENDIHAFIDPTGLTNPLRAGANLAPTLATLAGTQGRGLYAIRVAGNPGTRLVSV